MFRSLIKLGICISTIFFLLMFCHCRESDKLQVVSSALHSRLAFEAQARADYFYEKNVPDSAYYYYLNSNEALLQIKDTSNVVYNLIRISELQQNIGDYLQAETTLTEIFKFRQTKNSSYHTAIYNALGIIYRKLYNYPASIASYREAMTSDTLALNQQIVLSNIANVYYSQKQYHKSLNIFDSLAQLPEIRKVPTEYARVLNNLGMSRFQLDAKQGLSELVKGFKLRDSIADLRGLAISYGALATYYSDKDRAQAIAFEKQKLQLSRQLGNPNYELESLEHLLKISANGEASSYAANYIALSKELSEKNQTAKNQFAKIRFDYQKEIEENLLLKAETSRQQFIIEKERNQNQMLVFCGLLLVGAGIGWYFKIKRRHREEKITQVYVTETQIAKKIHDELANDIFNLVAYSENFDLAVEANKSRLLHDLEKAYVKTRNISSDHSSIRVDEHFLSDLTGLLQEYNGTVTKVIAVGLEEIKWSALSDIQKIAVYRVVQEFLVNMKKHSKASLVSVRFESLKKILKISYSDNGTGILIENLIPGKGLINAENRIKDMGGTFIFDSNSHKGLKIFITIPL